MMPADTLSFARTRPLRLEVVADTVDGVRAAVAGGADRIELVSALGVGGVTPSLGLMRAAAGCGIAVRAMIRPRPGDFTYSAAEIDLMRHDIDAARGAGLAGIVVGANLATGPLDAAMIETLVRHAAGLEVAIHRSFDLAPDPAEAIDICVSLGLVTVLTSGGAGVMPPSTASRAWRNTPIAPAAASRSWPAAASPPTMPARLS